MAFLIVSAAQTVPATQRFEVSSVTVCPPATVAQTDGKFTLSAVRPFGLQIERTRVVAICVTVESLIHMAYNDGQFSHPNAAARDVRGDPNWIRSERYTRVRPQMAFRTRI